MTGSKFLQDSGKLILATENFVVFGDSVLMHRRALTKEVSPGFLLGPGGRIDADEDVIASSVREVKEETGIELDPAQIELKAVIFHHSLSFGSVWVVFMTRTVLATDPGPLIHTDEGTNEWIKVEDLPNQTKLFPGSSYYHDHILTPRAGIMYTNIEWESGKLKRVLSSTTVPPTPS